MRQPKVNAVGGKSPPFLTTLKERLGGRSLGARVTRSGLAVLFASGFEQVVRLGRNILLSRLLLPEAFGAMALVLTVTTMLDSLSQVGIREAIVQSRHADSTAFLNGAWFLSLARGALLCVCSLLLAPLAAAFFGRTDIVPMLQVASVGLLFQGAVSVRSYVALKNLQTTRWAIVEQLGGVSGVVCSVVLSVAWRNAWGLVVGFALESFLRAALSFLFFPYRPRLKFDREMILSVLGYARRMMGVPILTFIYMQVDVFVVGRTQSAEMVGLYAMAVSLSKIPDALVSRFAAPVVVPAYASLQDRPEVIVRSLRVILRAIGVVAAPIVAAGLLYGDLVMTVLYTDRYAEVGLSFGLLLMASAIRNLSVPFASICMATDRADALRKVTAVRAAVVLVSVFPLTKWIGLNGAATSVLVASVVGWIAQAVELRAMFGPKARNLARGFMWGLAAAAPVVASWPVVVAARRGGDIRAAATALGAVLGSYGLYGAIAAVRRRALRVRKGRAERKSSDQGRLTP